MSVLNMGKNKWRVQVEMPPDNVTGKRRTIRRTVTGPKSKAIEMESRLKSQKAMLGDFTVDVTLGEYLNDLWLNEKADLAPQTIKKYKYHIDRYISPVVGSVKLQSINPWHVNQLIKSIDSDGQAFKVFVTLRAALNYARKMRFITENPCDFVEIKKPRPKHKPIIERTYSLEEAADIYTRIHGQWWEPLWIVCCFGGLRPEEACGLDVPRRNWDGKITVERVFTTSTKGYELFNKTKTSSSNRTVQLGTDQRDRILKATSGRVGPLGARPRNKVVNSRGTVEQFTKDYRKWCESNELRYIPPKDLRHTAATLMIANGADPSAVARVLGHSNIRTTLDFYVHPHLTASEAASTSIGDKVAEVISIKDRQKRAKK